MNPHPSVFLALRLACVLPLAIFCQAADPTDALLPPLPAAVKGSPAATAKPSLTAGHAPAAKATTAEKAAAPSGREQRFNLVVNGAPAAQVYLAMTQGTPYQLILPPDFAGSISIQLRNVTVEEALLTLKEVYGYDYRIEGERITMQPLSLQTRLYQVNYLNASRSGVSEIRVVSGSITNNQTGNSKGSSNSASSSSGSSNGDKSSSGVETSRMETRSTADVWTELKTVLGALVSGDGRLVTSSPSTGIIVVRAFPNEHAQVAAYLKSAQIAIARQVILEAKILEVALSDDQRKGINWAAFGHLSSSKNTRLSIGKLDAGMSATPAGGITGGQTISGKAEETLNNLADKTGLFGMVFRTDNFTAVIDLLEQQGTVHVLSSPRIATLNNQKAVLKVGTDEFFVTEVTSNNTTNSSGSTTSSPTVTLQPFFSGIALDVTPQIDERGSVILHVHPSVSVVSTVDKRLDLGSSGLYNLPLASSSVSETDSVVRAEDGQIIAIGGLMRQSSSTDRNGIPGLSKLPVVGGLFRSDGKSVSQRELVFLIKPIVVHGGDSWQPQIATAQASIEKLDAAIKTIALP